MRKSESTSALTVLQLGNKNSWRIKCGRKAESGGGMPPAGGGERAEALGEARAAGGFAGER